MRKLCGYFTLALALAVLGPDFSLGQDKKFGKKDAVTREDTTPQDYAALAQMKDITGRIASIDFKSNTLTLTVEWSHLEPKKDAVGKGANQKILQQQQQLQRDYDQAMRLKNPLQRQQAMARVQVQMQKMQASGLDNLFTVVKSSKDFDLEVMEKIKVARLTLERKFDDEGEVIKYTDEQLRKMKSPDITGAYTASVDDLNAGQTVKLWLSPPKEKKKSDRPAEKKSDSSSSDAKDKPQAASADANLTQVRMALIQIDSKLPDRKDVKDAKKMKE